jgi:hypothetical protein
MAIMPGTIEVSVLAPTPALRMSALEGLQLLGHVTQARRAV